MLARLKIDENGKYDKVDLFTDTAAILNLLNFRSIMGCPGGALVQYLRALFGQKENFNVYFSGKWQSLLHPNTAQRSFFPLQSFSRKRKEKLARKARVNTDRAYRIVLMPPGHPTILFHSNKFNMAPYW